MLSFEKINQNRYNYIYKIIIKILNIWMNS